MAFPGQVHRMTPKIYFTLALGMAICLSPGSMQPAALADEPACPGSYLYQPAFCMDYLLREPAEPYCPQPGDIFVCTGRELWAKGGHWLAFAYAPQHSGIVIAGKDGSLLVLEAGPHNTLRCRVLELQSELQSYEQTERIWVRRRCGPLTAEQSEQLTSFALCQEGVRFAVLRMFGQVTPFRSRGPLRTRYLGGPHGNRSSYYCSELVFEACVASGLLDATTTRPAASFPRDLFFGRSYNRYIDQHLDMSDWLPPARWTSCPGKEPSIRHHPRMDRDTN
jgi:hypothetical protein